MGETYNVRLEPVGIEFEVDEDETVLRGAFRQGLMLMHGCKEGQCAACKSFLLDGEVDLDKYSNFALNDFEKEEGWTLLCRAHAMSDLEVELINYDEEILRSGIPEQTEELTVETVESLTHDIYRLVLDATEITYRPGQYVDVHIPGGDDVRSFSMANLPDAGKLEFMIKAYPDGRFSGLLAGRNGDDGIKAGDRLTVTGPYGVFTMRRTSDRPLLFIGGGAGMAPILALLRALAAEGSERKAVFYYGARTPADLFHLDELAAIEERCPNFRFVPALSDCEEGETWDGERGLITDVVARSEEDLSGMDAYLCGPPPMVDAAIAMLDAKGVPEDRVFYDKFTTTAPE